MFHLLVINGGATHTESEPVSPGIGCCVPALAVFSLCEAGRTDDIPHPNPHICAALKNILRAKFMFVFL